MAPWVLHLWLGEGKPYQGGLAVLQQSCPAPSPTFGPCRLEGTLSPCHCLQCGESHRGHLAMAVDGWKSWELDISAGQRDPNSAAPSKGASETLFLPLFILLVANQPHFIFPALQMGDKPLAKSFTRVAGFTS